MTIREKGAKDCCSKGNDLDQEMTICQLKLELERTKEMMERNRMKSEEYHGMLVREETRMEALEDENQRLKREVFQVKETKNRMSEQVIKLSSTIYRM